MKKLLTIIILTCLLLVACGSDVQETKTEVKAAPPKPYGLYVHTDSDGCEYLIVYAEKSDTETWMNAAGMGVGVGVGVTAKVNQPKECQTID